LVESISGRKVTIIAPTQNDENNLGFDDIIEDLPAGQIIAFQFKRPFCTPSIPCCSGCYLETQQLQKLLFNFSIGEAYYVFVPYPFNANLIRNRKTLLHDSTAVAVHDVPNAHKISQKTRTVRVLRN